MARYEILVNTPYEDDPPPTALHRVGGPAIGLPTDRWPRYGGRCMQHAFTIDLADLELSVPKAQGARAVSVFVESYYEQDVDSADGITVVWLTQADIDAHPVTTPPRDFVPDALSDDMQGSIFELEATEDEPNEGDSYVGGEPVWNEDGPPEVLPSGAFVLQVSSWNAPFSRTNASLMVFEDGGYVQRERPDDEVPPRWPEAIARSKQIVVLDEPAPADALQKWGGLPPGVSEYDWPKGMTHLFTYVPDEFPEGEEGVAVAVFGRLSKTTNWGEQPSFFESRTLTQEELDDEDLTPPEGVNQLPERALELRPFPEGATWRDLQQTSFVGPRPAWRDPASRNASSTTEPVLQIASELLPNAPGRGSLCFLAGCYPWWMAEPDAPQAQVEAYRPEGTLYADETTAAVVVGVRIDFEAFSILPEQAEALERALLAALRARELDLTLFVPGDTTTDRDRELQAKFVLGRAVATTEADDWEPSPVEPAAVERALASFPTLDEAFWQEALAGLDGVQPPDSPAVYLLSWGPLCYAALYVGVPRSKDDAEPPTYRFVANQNMEQEWSSQGIDGVSLEGAEFSDILELTLSPAEDLAKVEKLGDAGYWLICRYD